MQPYHIQRNLAHQKRPLSYDPKLRRSGSYCVSQTTQIRAPKAEIVSDLSLLFQTIASQFQGSSSFLKAFSFLTLITLAGLSSGCGSTSIFPQPSKALENCSDLTLLGRKHPKDQENEVSANYPEYPNGIGAATFLFKVDPSFGPPVEANLYKIEQLYYRATNLLPIVYWSKHKCPLDPNGTGYAEQQKNEKDKFSILVRIYDASQFSSATIAQTISIVFTYGGYEDKGKQHLLSEILFNFGGFLFEMDPDKNTPGKISFFATAAHEIGHGLAVPHIPNSFMEATTRPGESSTIVFLDTIKNMLIHMYGQYWR
ncbi:MAG: hypothetical protein FD145_659 [Candidatus Saganbacteria bacterium]|uniref:Uncharacterized protein n=1 Tax=Candidatus Saganbacteria bacterium TaxID=2575572 RepID=A0A833L1J6_UNCSA|nr:MAG: hypothetical protein FD145_659 [Candidatus Saganbacteria bacterium]